MFIILYFQLAIRRPVLRAVAAAPTPRNLITGDTVYYAASYGCPFVGLGLAPKEKRGHAYVPTAPPPVAPRLMALILPPEQRC